MKIRITALILAMAAAAVLLSGCGSTPAELETVTTAATVPVTEPATEATTGPTTVPTEPPAPPTLLEEQGYVLWDGADTVEAETEPDTWTNKGDFIPISAKFSGSYKDVHMQFTVVGSDRKEYRDLADTDVSVLLYEIPGSGFADSGRWLAEKLAPFHAADQKSGSGKATFAEWAAENQDQKLIYAKISYTIKGTELYLQTLEDGVKMKDLFTMHSYPDLVDAGSGAVFCIRGKYDPYDPEVGCWTVGPEGEETRIQAWFTRNYSWDVQEGSRANYHMYFEYFVLVPADYEDLSFCMHEYLTAEKTAGRLILGDSGKSSWGVGSIFDEEFLECTDLQFHFFGLKVKE